MGYRLRMSAEIYDWLAELRDSDPPAAVLTARALAALADGGDRLGPPLVITVDGRLVPRDLWSALDQRYDAWLESMTAMRREVADAAMRRRDLERQLAGPEPPQDPAGLRERLAAAIEDEERLTVASQQEQLRADAFRSRKEVLKAAYTAARAEQLIEQAQDAGEHGDPATSARLDEVISQIEQELDQEAPAEELMELRPGAPADSGIRILFGVEPPGTALLIAVLEGPDAVRDHYGEAVRLAAEALWETRAGPVDQAAEAAARTFGDARSFLAEFFPGGLPGDP
jgi:hypothetical protein